MYTTVCTKNTHNNKYYPGRASVGIQDVIGRVQLNRLREYLAREFKLVPLERLVAFLLQFIRRHDVIFLFSRPFFLSCEEEAFVCFFFVSSSFVCFFRAAARQTKREVLSFFASSSFCFFRRIFLFFFSFLKLALVHFTLTSFLVLLSRVV